MVLLFGESKSSRLKVFFLAKAASPDLLAETGFFGGLFCPLLLGVSRLLHSSAPTLEYMR